MDHVCLIVYERVTESRSPIYTFWVLFLQRHWRRILYHQIDQNRVFEKLSCIWSFSLISGHHFCDKLSQIIRVNLRNFLDLWNFDQVHQLKNSFGLKGPLERTDFINDTAHTPNICFGRVKFLVNDFGRQIIRSPCHSLTLLPCWRENFRDAKVSNFDVEILVDENILRFNVPVEDLFTVNELNSQNQLEKPSDDEILIKMLVFGLHELNLMMEVLFWILRDSYLCNTP